MWAAALVPAFIIVFFLYITGWILRQLAFLDPVALILLKIIRLIARNEILDVI